VAVALALWAVALGLVRVGTLRLRRRGIYTAGIIDAPFRPSRPRDTRLRRQVVPDWFAGLVLGVGVLVFVAATLPDQVNAIGYLTDSTSSAVFLPLSYARDCGRDGCTTATEGIMEASGRSMAWPAQLPLRRAVTVQAPTWLTGPGQTLVTSDDAVAFTLLAMIMDAGAVVAVSGFVLLVGRRLRRGQRSPLTGATQAGGLP
jgi:hypothetical protein